MRNPIRRRLCLLRWHRERASAKGFDRASLGAFAIALVACLPVASSATTPVDLCVGDPCVVSRHVSIDSGSDLDFGAAALVFGPEACQAPAGGWHDDGAAASIVFEAWGARRWGVFRSCRCYGSERRLGTSRCGRIYEGTRGS